MFLVLLLYISQDTKFAVKARLCGMLPVTVGLLKRRQGDQHNLVTLLSVVKTLASNCECQCTVRFLTTALPQHKLYSATPLQCTGERTSS